MREDTATKTIYDGECPFADISWEYETEHRSDTAGYTFIVDVTDGTEDYIFYQMEGHSLVCHTLCIVCQYKYVNIYIYIYIFRWR